METFYPATLDHITRIEYQGQLVLTTAQLAEFYGCEKIRIQKNYNRNADRFIEGKHFFRLDGDELRAFKHYMANSQNSELPERELVPPQLNLLYLWTKRGSARHAKMLNTDKAWEVFELLEDNYFNPTVDYNDTTPGADFWWEVEKPKRKSQRARALELQCVRELRRHAELADDPELRRKLLAKASSILLGEESSVTAEVQLTLFK